MPPATVRAEEMPESKEVFHRLRPVAASSAYRLWELPATTMLPTTAGEQSTVSPVSNSHRLRPLAASRAYSRWSSLPTNTTPPDATGEVATMSFARKDQRLRPVAV